jgi:serine/threonine protein kinase
LQVIGPDRNEFALKRINLSGTNPEARQGFIKEIELLKKLQKRRNIIRYIDSEVRRCNIGRIEIGLSRDRMMVDPGVATRRSDMPFVSSLEAL